MQSTVDQYVKLETVSCDKFYLDGLVRFLREAFIRSGLEELLESGAFVVV
jgi:hypothetical protein